MATYRKLGRETSHRNLMLRNLVTDLLRNGRIETTVTRAKETRRMAEKMTLYCVLYIVLKLLIEHLALPDSQLAALNHLIKHFL